jgi:hypothetical protein
VVVEVAHEHVARDEAAARDGRNGDAVGIDVTVLRHRDARGESPFVGAGSYDLLHRRALPAGSTRDLRLRFWIGLDPGALAERLRAREPSEPLKRRSKIQAAPQPSVGARSAL